MEREKFLIILRELRKVCEEVNQGLIEENPDNKVIYEVLQFSDLAKKWNSVFNIADFYNHNWLGNVDFMHIPDFMQTFQNCRNYPIIIAREKDTDNLLGISTIKYDENTGENIDPYFPEKDAKYFSITGILSKKDNPYRGIGKKIYEIALKGAYNYEKYYPGTMMMCVIDCRNKQSLRALTSAAEKINQSDYVGINKELPVHILGYYELRDKESQKILEAPTLVIEIGLEEKEAEQIVDDNNLEYEKSNKENLFDSLLRTLKCKFSKYGINEPVVEEDTDCGMVYFYSLQDKERCKIQTVSIESNGTEEGNDRIPVDDEQMHRFVGPIPTISVEEGR